MIVIFWLKIEIYINYFLIYIQNFIIIFSISILKHSNINMISEQIKTQFFIVGNDRLPKNDSEMNYYIQS